ncbi:CBS domain-containing protein [Salinarchaeum laminariae]|uniref:CBS domain-containing protein n=1 Tax=Salinarchaeum laminariae TaxID=869888 RepID=UPI0020BEBC67|nr:CBS domain-containing protein [Salinarchaeum laminariae]
MEGVTARDVMSRTFAGVTEGDDVDDVRRLMVDERTDDVLVLRGNEPVGQVAAHDLLDTGTDEIAGDATVESVMRPAPDPIDADSDLADVLTQLSVEDGGRLPVANGDAELVGVVTEADVIAAASTVVTQPGATEVGGPEGLGGTERIGSQDTRSTQTGAVAGTAQATADPDDEQPVDPSEQYSNQSVCESCGTLSADLQVVNGQSICPECRDV